MTKDELVQMARDAGLDVGPCPWFNKPDYWVEGETNNLASLINSILERAAVECGEVTHMSGADHGDLRDACAESVRALKIKE